MWSKLKIVLEMIKIEHTLFAMPFALIGAQYWPHEESQDARTLFWIVDRDGWRDVRRRWPSTGSWIASTTQKIPRTAMRAIPAGLLTPKFVVGFTDFLVVAPNYRLPGS